MGQPPPLVISCNVSSLTREQFDMSKDSRSGHDVAADRTAALADCDKMLYQDHVKEGNPEPHVPCYSASRTESQVRDNCKQKSTTSNVKFNNVAI